MMSNNIYLLQVSLTWGLLYVFYLIFLGKETFFKTNRFYLLGALLVGLILPFAQAMMQHAEVGVQVVQLPILTITNLDPALSPNEVNQEEFDIMFWLSIVYWVGFGVMALRFLRDLVGIAWLVRGSRKEQNDDFTTIHIERDMAPFSFFNYLFVFDKDRFSEEEWHQVLLHEKTHMDQLHSLDILFTEVLKIIFWWNPLTYLFQRALREVHEYEADHAVKKQENIKQYGLLLMKQSLSGNQVAVANSFINSQLKKRIVMMTKKRSNSLAKIKYAWSLPLLLMLFFISFGNRVLAQTTPKIAEEFMDTIFVFNPDTYEEKMEIVKSLYYENNGLSKIAVLKGCETAGDLDAQKSCSDSKLLNKLYSVIEYPEAARLAGMDGKVVVKILIDGNGQQSFEILKDSGFGMGAEVVRALHAADFKWSPAELDGKEVNVEFILPVLFKIEKDDAAVAHIQDEQNAFSQVKINYTADKFRVDFKYADGEDENINMTIYDLDGRLVSSDGGTKTYFESGNLNTKSALLIVVLEDDHGNKAVRKVARTD